MKQMSFGSVLEAVEAISQEEQETLVDILRRRMVESNRRLIVESVRQAQEDFLSGNYQEVTVDELLQEILC